MKKIPVAIIFVALLVISGVALGADQYTTMQDIMKKLSNAVTYLEDTENQEVVNIDADIITEDGITYTRTLHQGWTYGIMAFGDWRISDLDITVYEDVDGEWTEVGKDDEADNNPLVVITPSTSAEYMIEFTIYKFSGDYTAAHYGMIIYHEIEE